MSPQKVAPPLVRLGAPASLRAASAASAASASLALPAALSRSRTFSSLLFSSRRSSSHSHRCSLESHFCVLALPHSEAPCPGEWQLLHTCQDH